MCKCPYNLTLGNLEVHFNLYLQQQRKEQVKGHRGSIIRLHLSKSSFYASFKLILTELHNIVNNLQEISIRKQT